MKRDDIPFHLAGQGGTLAVQPPLRFLTAGSVDDGKSTLIGRLLLDGRALLVDQIDALRAKAAGSADPEALDLSLVTDGLEAEREQGITIDVAYRSFQTPVRRFLIADAPGHEQYTRNMVTAAAGSDAALVLVDVTKLRLDADAGTPLTLLPQTRRHALIAHRLGVRHLVFVVNKLDAVAAAPEAFGRVRDALQAFAHDAGFTPAGIVPVSALRGDNVSTASNLVPAYSGPTLLALLESLPVGDAATSTALSRAWLPVQWVDAAGPVDAAGVRQRVLWGRVAHGAFAPGDPVTVWPSGQRAVVQAVHPNGGANVVANVGAHVGAKGHAGKEANGAVAAGHSAGVVLDRPLDVSRGDWLAGGGDAVAAATDFTATLAWLDTEPAVPGRTWWLRHGNRWVKGRLVAIDSRLDIASLASAPAEALAVNDIGVVQVALQSPLPLAAFGEDRTRGALVVVDPATHRTSGVLLVT